MKNRLIVLKIESNLKYFEEALSSDYGTASGTATAGLLQYHSNEIQINYRYDGSNYSEFSIIAYRIDPSGVIIKLTGYGFNGAGWKTIKNIDKTQVGQQLEGWSAICGDYGTANSSTYVMFNTYERDWYQSLKPLGAISVNGATLHLNERMTYVTEYYSFDPPAFMMNINNYKVDLNYIYSHWAKWYTNSKSRFRIWRVHI